MRASEIRNVSRFTTQINDFGAKWSRGLLVIFLLGFAVVFGVAIGFTSNNSCICSQAWLLSTDVQVPSGICPGSFALALPFEACLLRLRVVREPPAWCGLYRRLRWPCFPPELSAACAGLLPGQLSLGGADRLANDHHSLGHGHDRVCEAPAYGVVFADSLPGGDQHPINRKQLKVVMALFVRGRMRRGYLVGMGILERSSFLGSGRASLVLGETEMDPNYFAAMLLVHFHSLSA